MQILNIKSYNKFSIITVINWNLYQQDEQQMNNRWTTDEHKQECIKNDKEKNPADFSNFLKRYSDENLIQKVFDVIKSTRKSGKVSDSILIAQLQKRERYPVEQVESGIMVYLEKGYADQGKREAYLPGIIRNSRGQIQKPVTRESTGSALLDSQYAVRDWIYSRKGFWAPGSIQAGGFEGVPVLRGWELSLLRWSERGAVLLPQMQQERESYHLEKTFRR